MMFISFSWTTPALLADPPRKFVTRRVWANQHYLKFHMGDLVSAYDKSPRAGGKKIAVIQLTHEPYQEALCDAPDEDYELEGFGYLSEIGATVDGWTPKKLWQSWKLAGVDDIRTVVRFRRVEVLR